MKFRLSKQGDNVIGELNGYEYTFGFDANGWGIYGIVLPGNDFYSSINKGEARAIYKQYGLMAERFKANSIDLQSDLLGNYPRF